MNRIDRVLAENAGRGEKTTVHCVPVGRLASAAALARRMDAAGGIWELRGNMPAGELCGFVKRLRRRLAGDIPVVLSLSFHQIYAMGLEPFTDSCIEAGADGVRIRDLPMEEQPQLRVYFLKAGAPYLVQEICPQSGDRIPDLTAGAGGFVYCAADPALWDRKEAYGSPLMFFLYAAEAVCPAPLILDFPDEGEWTKDCLKIAAGMSVKEDIAVPALFC